MISKSMDGVDLDIVMFLENLFAIHIPDDEANFGGPLGMEEWLEQHLSNQRPTKDAATLLRMLADAQQRPELAARLDGPWRREQISAFIRDIFRKRAYPMELHEMLLLPPLQRFGEHQRQSGYSLVRDWWKLFPNKSTMELFTVLLTLILLYRQFLR